MKTIEIDELIKKLEYAKNQSGYLNQVTISKTKDLYSIDLVPAYKDIIPSTIHKLTVY